VNVKIAVECPKCKKLLPFELERLQPGIKVKCPYCAEEFSIRSNLPLDLLVQYSDDAQQAADLFRRMYIHAYEISECLRSISIVMPTPRCGRKRKPSV
jgi:hypothetical protein